MAFLDRFSKATRATKKLNAIIGTIADNDIKTAAAAVVVVDPVRQLKNVKNAKTNQEFLGALGVPLDVPATVIDADKIEVIKTIDQYEALRAEKAKNLKNKHFRPALKQQEKNPEIAKINMLFVAQILTSERLQREIDALNTKLLGLPATDKVGIVNATNDITAKQAEIDAAKKAPNFLGYFTDINSAANRQKLCFDLFDPYGQYRHGGNKKLVEIQNWMSTDLKSEPNFSHKDFIAYLLYKTYQIDSFRGKETFKDYIETTAVSIPKGLDTAVEAALASRQLDDLFPLYNKMCDVYIGTSYIESHSTLSDDEKQAKKNNIWRAAIGEYNEVLEGIIDAVSGKTNFQEDKLATLTIAQLNTTPRRTYTFVEKTRNAIDVATTTALLSPILVPAAFLEFMGRGIKAVGQIIQGKKVPLSAVSPRIFDIVAEGKRFLSDSLLGIYPKYTSKVDLLTGDETKTKGAKLSAKIFMKLVMELLMSLIMATTIGIMIRLFASISSFNRGFGEDTGFGHNEEVLTEKSYEKNLDQAQDQTDQAQDQSTSRSSSFSDKSSTATISTNTQYLGDNQVNMGTSQNHVIGMHGQHNIAPDTVLTPSTPINPILDGQKLPDTPVAPVAPAEPAVKKYVWKNADAASFFGGNTTSGGAAEQASNITTATLMGVLGAAAVTRAATSLKLHKQRSLTGVDEAKKDEIVKEAEAKGLKLLEEKPGLGTVLARGLRKLTSIRSKDEGKIFLHKR